MTQADFDAVRQRTGAAIEVACSVERVMDALRDGHQWVQWAGPMESARWTSPPGRVNCTRDVVLAGGAILKEIFYCWDEGHRVAFYVSQANIRSLRLFAEEHRITALAPDRIRLQLTLVWELKGAARWFFPVRTLARFSLPGLLAKYKKLLESSPA